MNDFAYTTVMETTSHVLLVENDRQFAQLIVQELGCEGYQISLAEDVMEELIARVGAHLKQRAKVTHLPQFEQLVFDRKARQVHYRHQEIELTAKKFYLLEYLVRYPNPVLARNQILDGVWGHESLASSNVIEVYIRYLRIKLKAQGAKQFIHTVRGVGYVLRTRQHQNLAAFSGLDQQQYPHLKQIADLMKAS